MEAFLAFFGQSETQQVSSPSDTPGETPNKQQSAALAMLPSEVPILPASFRERKSAQDELTAALLDSSGGASTTLTAPKSRVSSQGMGGVGKTMLTAAGTAYACL